ADTLLQQDAQSHTGGHRSLGAHARFGQSQMQRIVATRGQLAVNRDQVLHAADLARKNDLAAFHAHLLCTLCGTDGRCDKRLVHHRLGVPGLGPGAVFVHQLREQFLVEAAPVHADAHGFAPAHCRFDHLAELLVVLVALAHVAGVDAVLGQRLRTVRVVGEQAVPVVVEVADQRNVDSHPVELLADVGHLRGCLGRVDGDAHQFRSGHGQFLDLDRGAERVLGVGVGHGLHTHRRIATDGHDARTPHHAGLARAARPGRSELDGQAGLHYLTSKRATLSRETDCRSNGLPRTCTSVASARPTVTCSGSAPETPAASPGASRRLTATTPFASVTSTHEGLLVRNTTMALAAAAGSLPALAAARLLAGTAADAPDAAPAGNGTDAAPMAAMGCATLAAGSRTVPGTATGCGGEIAFGELAAAATLSSRCIEGSRISTSAPSSNAKTTRNVGLASRVSQVGAVPSPGARKGALRPSSVRIRRGAAVWGRRSSTGCGSILSVRQTLAASARA